MWAPRRNSPSTYAAIASVVRWPTLDIRAELSENAEPVCCERTGRFGPVMTQHRSPLAAPSVSS